MHCYCSICRKTAGGGGYAINIMGDAKTLTVSGRKHLAYYRAKLPEDGKTVHSPARRHFCKRCGSALFISDPRWLNEAPNRGRVLAIATAQPRHGGSGALYVLLKRRRES